ncbi:hypothetical protein [Bacillus thermotolerans]|nr:hypothetical protein [Bacillus thermotolerans]KKB44184.1 hypothetical protein QY96_03510 [Bacillus thermotolerans]
MKSMSLAKVLLFLSEKDMINNEMYHAYDMKEQVKSDLEKADKALKTVE